MDNPDYKKLQIYIAEKSDDNLRPLYVLIRIKNLDKERTIEAFELIYGRAVNCVEVSSTPTRYWDEDLRRWGTSPGSYKETFGVDAETIYLEDIGPGKEITIHGRAPDFAGPRSHKPSIRCSGWRAKFEGGKPFGFGSPQRPTLHSIRSYYGVAPWDDKPPRPKNG